MLRVGTFGCGLFLLLGAWLGIQPALSINQVEQHSIFESQIQLVEPKEVDLQPLFSTPLKEYLDTDRNEQVRREKLFSAWISALLHGDFKALETFGQRYLDERVTLGNGEYALNIFYNKVGSYLADAGKDNAQFPEVLLENWARQYPDSLHVRIVQARYRLYTGWRFRGGDYAYKVGEEEMQEHLRQQQDAWAILAHLRASRERNPDIYTTLMLVAEGSENPYGEMENLFKEGVAVDPDYIHLYRNMAQYTMPRWYGGPGDLKKLMAWVYAYPLKKTDPDILYTKMALKVRESKHHPAEFKSYGLSWPIIKQGYLDMYKLHMLTVRDLYQLYWFSEVYGDKATAAGVKNLLGEENVRSWHPEGNF